MRPSGFTLLELLVAISIFSVIGLGSYQLLQSVSESHARVRVSIDGYIRMSQALTIMQRDFNQFVARQVRDEYGETISPMVLDSEEFLIEFTRGGWSNPGGRSRSELQRVAYSIDYQEEFLIRHFWVVLDRAEDSEPRSQILLESVTDFRVTGYTDLDLEANRMAEGNDDELLSEGSFEATVPVGVEVVIATDQLGEVRRIFQLVDSFSEGSTNKTESESSSNLENDTDKNDADAPSLSVLGVSR